VLAQYIFRNQVAIDLKKKRRTWNCFLIPKWKKHRMLGCAWTLSKTGWLSILEYLPHSSEVWRLIHIPAVVVSKEPSHLAEVGLKLLPSLKTYIWYMWHAGPWPAFKVFGGKSFVYIVCLIKSAPYQPNSAPPKCIQPPPI